MGRTLKPEEIKQLLKIKKTGEYQRKSNGEPTRHKQKTLLRVLLQYCKITNTRFFKLKYFNKEKAKRTPGKSILHSDCPLRAGELINAVKLGHQLGVLIPHGTRGTRRWEVKHL